MDILVTGGAGFIGSHLVDALILLRHKVVVVDDLSSGKLENVNKEAFFVRYNLASDLPYTHDVGDAKFDLVYHLAARARVIPSFEKPLDYHRNNVLGTAKTLELARLSGARRFIFASSSSIYGGYDKTYLPFAEHMAPRPKSPYAWDKMIGEDLCMEYGECFKLSTAALRFFNVYGPRMASGQYSTVIQAFLDTKATGKPLPINGDGTHTRDYTQVNDVVRALINAGEADLPHHFGAFNIGAGENHSVNEVAELIGGPVVHLPEVDEPTDTLAELEFTKKWLRWMPKMKFKDGIEELKKYDKLKRT